MEDFFEFDLDYEYDAACFYDFTRPESLSESEEAQLWFRFAPSYPPSRKQPYIRTLDIFDSILISEFEVKKFV